ncbi:MAG: hypothetical protein ACK4MV_16365 [Beijerinckiaceae bacterium]
MRTHDLRRCYPLLATVSGGGRALWTGCGCGHVILIHDHVLVPEGGPQGVRFRVTGTIRDQRTSRVGYFIEFAPRTMREVHVQEAEDARRIMGGAA